VDAGWATFCIWRFGQENLHVGALVVLSKESTKERGGCMVAVYREYCSYTQDLNGKDAHLWDFACSQINDLVISSNGQWLIVITQEKKIRLYDLLKGEKQRYMPFFAVLLSAFNERS